MWIALGIALLALWLLAKFVWGVASMGIHLLLVVAAIVLIAHFARGFFTRGGDGPVRSP